MLMKKKIIFVISARASITRIRTVIEFCKKKKNLDIIVVATASSVSNKYGNSIDKLEEYGIYCNWKINTLFNDEKISSQPKTTAAMINELSTFFENQSPDAVVTVADRFETMATAIAASYMNIPLVHIQGGEVTGNIDEKVRHSVTKLADLHFVSNKDSFKRVKLLGERCDSIHLTGCPSVDVAYMAKSINIKKIQLDGVGSNIDLKKPYIMVLQHSDTNRYELSREDVNKIIKAIIKINMQTLWFWPNPDIGTSKIAEGIRSFRENNDLSNILFIKHIPDLFFLKLLDNAKCLVGNSSVGIRECSFLGTPVVNIGDRQKNRLRGKNVIDVDLDIDSIYSAIIKQSKIGKFSSSTLYGNGDAGKKTAEILSKTCFSYFKQITY